MSQIRETKLNPVPIQTGYGVPTHISPAGSFYFDFNTGIEYQNKDGVVNWVRFLDATSGGGGGVDVFVTGGTYSSGTAIFTNNTGGTFNVTGFSTGGGSGSTTFTGGTVSGATIFTGGLTANTFSATTYLGLPTDIHVTGGTYLSGAAIFTNNTGGTFSVTGFPVGGGGGQTLYLNLSQSKNGNKYLSTTASTSAQQSTGVTINNGVTATIASFETDQLNSILIPSGIWTFHLHSYKNNNNASFNIFVEVYKKTSGGTSTLLFQTDPEPVLTNSPNPSMQITDSYFSGTPIVITDSLVAVVRATNTSNQSHIITLFSEGSQHYSYAVSTLQTQQGLTCVTLSGCSVIQTIQSDINNKLDKSGGTVSGPTIFTGGLTADTISATTYFGLPIDIRVTGGTYDTGISTITFTNNTGGTFNVTGITATGGGGAFTGGTVSGATNFINGLTANTISATTYQGLPVYQRLNDNDIVNFFNYCGLALSGTSQGSPTWQISRISWSSTTPTTAYAVGAWTGRTSLIYT